MKFKTLTIENFLAVSAAEVNLADRGLILIQGVNEDDPSANSNGAGKSSVVDALCWVLFGTTARGASGDDVVNDKASKECRVTITVVDGTDEYRITRHRRHKTGKNSLVVEKKDPDPACAATDLSKGTDKETQKVVEAIIGCSYEVFRAAVYAGQEQMPDLPALTDKALKELVEEAAGIQVLERAYEVARQKLKDKTAEVEAARHRLSGTELRMGDIEADVERSKIAHGEWDDKRKLRVEEIKHNVKTLVAANKAREGELAAFDMPAITARLDAIDAQIAGVAHEHTWLATLTKALRDAEIAEAGLRTKVTAQAGEVRTRKTGLEQIESQVGQPCGECGKEYTSDDIADAAAIAARKLKAAATELRTLRCDHEKAVQSVTDAREAVERYSTTMTDVSALSDERKALSARLDAARAVERVIDRTKTEAERLVGEAKRLVGEENPFAAAITAAVGRLTDAAAAVAREKAKVTALEDELRVYEAAVAVYGPAGVRAHILDTVTPFLNDRTASYLGALSDGNITATWSTLSTTKSGDVREKFQITVTNDTGGKSFANLSGGEKRKARLATALALQDLVASRASKPIDLFVGDEIDDALDTAGLERLMGVLEVKARERGTVLVVSHSDLKDWIRQVWTVRKKSGGSTIEAS